MSSVIAAARAQSASTSKRCGKVYNRVLPLSIDELDEDMSSGSRPSLDRQLPMKMGLLGVMSARPVMVMRKALVEFARVRWLQQE
jgi:hypothetical protein